MVGNVTGTHERRTLGMTAKIHQATHSESNNAGCFELAIRTRKAKAGYRGHDQSWADHPQCLVTETDPIQISERPILNQYIGVCYQSTEFSLSLRGFEIEDDTFLVCVICSKRQAAVRMHDIVFERPLPSHRIAGGALDKNHFRAEDWGEQHGVHTPAHGEIDNAQTGKCTRGIQCSRHVEAPSMALTK